VRRIASDDAAESNPGSQHARFGVLKPNGLAAAIMLAPEGSPLKRSRARGSRPTGPVDPSSDSKPRRFIPAEIARLGAAARLDRPPTRPIVKTFTARSQALADARIDSPANRSW